MFLGFGLRFNFSKRPRRFTSPSSSSSRRHRLSSFSLSSCELPFTSLTTFKFLAHRSPREKLDLLAVEDQHCLGGGVTNELYKVKNVPNAMYLRAPSSRRFLTSLHYFFFVRLWTIFSLFFISGLICTVAAYDRKGR